MTDNFAEKRYEAVVDAADRVLSAFRAGVHPTEQQLNRLDGAIFAVNGLRVCGHRFIEDCSCDDGDPGKDAPTHG